MMDDMEMTLADKYEVLKRRYMYLQSIGPTEFKRIWGDVLVGGDFGECVDARIAEDAKQDAVMIETAGLKAQGL